MLLASVRHNPPRSRMRLRVRPVTVAVGPVSEERLQCLGIGLEQPAYRFPNRLAHLGKLAPFEQARALDGRREHEVRMPAGGEHRVPTAHSERQHNRFAKTWQLALLSG